MFSRRLIVAFTLVALAVMPAAAHARAGMGGSMGSRGMRTYMAPPPTRTAPSVAPIQRSVTPVAPQQQPSMGAPAYQPTYQPQMGFAQRNPFMTGFLGGLVGAGVGSMLFGHGFGMGGLGFAGGLGVMTQFLLLAGLAWLAYSFFRGRRDQQPVAYPNFGQARTPYDVEGHASHIPSVPLPHAAVLPPPGQDVALADADFDEFERLLPAVQRAWSMGDIAALRRIVTPEMLSYFAEQLATNTSKGVVNTVEDVKLEQADVAEAWREGEIDYVTVSLRFSAHDYMSSLDDGRVVDGSKTEHIVATETWTFMRQAGGRWLLSAIQQ
jgi:predicted lipid-binding transport protein (Tim44 family)